MNAHRRYTEARIVWATSMFQQPTKLYISADLYVDLRNNPGARYDWEFTGGEEKFQGLLVYRVYGADHLAVA